MVIYMDLPFENGGSFHNNLSLSVGRANEVVVFRFRGSHILGSRHRLSHCLCLVGITAETPPFVSEQNGLDLTLFGKSVGVVCYNLYKYGNVGLLIFAMMPLVLMVKIDVFPIQNGWFRGQR